MKDWIRLIFALVLLVGLIFAVLSIGWNLGVVLVSQMWGAGMYWQAVVQACLVATFVLRQFFGKSNK